MKEHGIFTVRPAGDVLLIRCEGAWNYEAATRYVDEVTRQAETMGPGPWCSLADLREWELGTPEATPLIIDLSARLSQLGRRHAAAVIGHLELVRIVGDHIFSRVRPEETPGYRYFAEPAEAREWLEGLGYRFGDD